MSKRAARWVVGGGATRGDKTMKQSGGGKGGAKTTREEGSGWYESVTEKGIKGGRIRCVEVR